MSKQIFEKFDGGEVTDDMLAEARRSCSMKTTESGAKMPRNQAHSRNQVSRVGLFCSHLLMVMIGSRVRLSKDRLRAQYLPHGAACSYARVRIEDRLTGNVFACRWNYNGKTVCWVTQLVVHRDFRERGIAVSLLIQIRQDEDEIYGLMSSHPAACLAAAKAFGNGIGTVRLDFIRKHAGAVMNASPIGYAKDADLRGSLFHTRETNGVVSSVYTNFFVDHTEPLEALAWVRDGLDWPLGELLDGHEFLFLLEVRRRDRLRSRSTSRPQTVS
ncbi:uncharacterized protein Z518_07313 [Rhinocladiella mackenziei CBS 650.93]|uniref:N-acetyltransferase domain-containing protein n=1 Tax=Rhinocladiella mackenziei CBS 650.93 TaxID=1442369 RepID=A0A0D2J431_9EURO|nr:uncharacterized protein Z518_07313 [Rhinocladiella mackenziei CBS 650.93]KIX03760.1 hypothetical protein Z518_07313 [Rhinocladiella mackenziei CBS 650.93]